MIDALWHATELELPYLVLPDGCVDVVERDAGLRVVGPMTQAVEVRLQGQPTRGVRLVPGAARALLGVSPRELVDAVVPLEEFCADRRLEDLAARAQALVPCETTTFVVRWLLTDPAVRISTIASALGWSSRHLRRRFVAEVGIGPKLFARIVRIHRVAARLPKAELGMLAHQCGYADQAHLTREVRALVGTTPTDWRRRTEATAPGRQPLGIS